MSDEHRRSSHPRDELSDEEFAKIVERAVDPETALVDPSIVPE
ncbi:hypothetical protein [Rhodococcus qingshengii]|nr:hypothetical protein [Rhodococcus qingshengii]